MSRVLLAGSRDPSLVYEGGEQRSDASRRPKTVRSGRRHEPEPRTEPATLLPHPHAGANAPEGRVGGPDRKTEGLAGGLGPGGRVRRPPGTGRGSGRRLAEPARGPARRVGPKRGGPRRSRETGGRGRFPDVPGRRTEGLAGGLGQGTSPDPASRDRSGVSQPPLPDGTLRGEKEPRRVSRGGAGGGGPSLDRGLSLRVAGKGSSRGPLMGPRQDSATRRVREGEDRPRVLPPVGRGGGREVRGEVA